MAATHPDPDGDPFEALGDPNRREILRLLGQGDKAVIELAESMPISRPAVSRHLRLLKQRPRHRHHRLYGAKHRHSSRSRSTSLSAGNRQDWISGAIRRTN